MELVLENNVRVLIDKEDCNRVADKKWRNGSGGNLICNHKMQDKWKTLTLQKFILLPQIEASDEFEVSTVFVNHINDNKLDNRKTNLEILPRKSLFSKIREKRLRSNFSYKNKASKYKGVRFNKHTRFWEAWIQCNKVKTKIGSFFEEEAAAKSYDCFARDLFGLQAYTNFPDNHYSKEEVLKLKTRQPTSKYRGVTWHIKYSKWTANIRDTNKQMVFIGNYLVELEAAKAYDIKATQLFGSGAKLNFAEETK